MESKKAWQGTFIAFEGIDGAGITTQSKILAERLTQLGKVVKLTKEPSAGPIGQVIGGVLRKEMAHEPCVLALLFAADRVHHVSTEVLPALSRGEVVISDRYVLSSLAFQGVYLPISWVKEVNSCAPQPDLCILIDVGVETAGERMRKRGTTAELFETEDDARLIRENYLRLAGELPNTTVVSGAGSIEEIASNVWDIVESRFGWA